MTSALAERLTAEHRQQVLDAGGLLARAIRIAAMQAGTDDIDAWWRTAEPNVVRQVTTVYTALAKVARAYLIKHAAAEGVRLAPATVTPVAEQLVTSLRVTGPVAFKTNMKITQDAAAARQVMAKRLAESAQRLAVAGSRDTVMTTVQRSPKVAGWQRNSAAGACAFCLMLTSRGAVYGSEKSSSFRAHDGCGCMPTPLYRREPASPRAEKLEAEWREATRGKTGAEALAAWREHVAKTRPAPPT